MALDWFPKTLKYCTQVGLGLKEPGLLGGPRQKTLNPREVSGRQQLGQES